MQHDVQLRAAARVIYETVYPTEEWAPIGFEVAELYQTIHYRQAIEAARQAGLRLSEAATVPLD